MANPDHIILKNSRAPSDCSRGQREELTLFNICLAEKAHISLLYSPVKNLIT